MSKEFFSNKVTGNNERKTGDNKEQKQNASKGKF